LNSITVINKSARLFQYVYIALNVTLKYKYLLMSQCGGTKKSTGFQVARRGIFFSIFN